MKKILSLIILLIALTSCLAKVDLEQKGNITFDLNKSIARSINSSTTAIDIIIHEKGKPETAQAKSIVHTPGAKHQVEFKDLVEGDWHILITFREGQYTLGIYEDIINVSSSSKTVVDTKEQKLRKVTSPYTSSDYFIANGQINAIPDAIAIEYLGHTYWDYQSQDNANIVFELSQNENFSSKQDISAINSIIIKYDTVESIGLINYVQPETKYYWRAKITSSYSGASLTSYSDTFNFTTIKQSIRPIYITTDIAEGEILSNATLVSSPKYIYPEYRGLVYSVYPQTDEANIELEFSTVQDFSSNVQTPYSYSSIAGSSGLMYSALSDIIPQLTNSTFPSTIYWRAKTTSIDSNIPVSYSKTFSFTVTN